MAWPGRSGSSDGMRLRNEDPKEPKPGSISPEFSSASQDCFRSVGSKETLKRQHDSILNRQGEADDEYQIDDSSPAAEKKRRLTIEQLNYLEMSFEGDMKLEPERKAFLAKRLGLVPRQVAIWFQNRRARWKNKQLEQDYEVVKAKYDIVVKENETLLKVNKAVVEENKKLMAEVTRMIVLLQSLDSGCNSGVFQTLDITQLDSTRRGTTQALDPGYLLQEQQQQPQAEEGYLSSCKSELTVPTKSLDDQSEVQDSGQSYDAPVGMVGAPRAAMDNLKVAMVCPKGTLDDSEGLYGNVFNPLLIQRSAADGMWVEDACTFCLDWEDQGAGFFQYQ